MNPLHPTRPKPSSPFRKLAVGAALLATLGVAGTGCARRVHVHTPPVKAVVVLDQEHHDKNVVIVKAHPPRHRHCWRHRGHWHCRR